MDLRPRIGLTSSPLALASRVPEEDSILIPFALIFIAAFTIPLPPLPIPVIELFPSPPLIWLPPLLKMPVASTPTLPLPFLEMESFPSPPLISLP
ncbi:MAG: hypothetical protein ACYTXA_00795 [Nostoc sp.]